MSDEVKIKSSIDKSTVDGVSSLEAEKYKYGFDSDIEQEFAPKGELDRKFQYLVIEVGLLDSTMKMSRHTNRLENPSRWISLMCHGSVFVSWKSPIGLQRFSIGTDVDLA